MAEPIRPRAFVAQPAKPPQTAPAAPQAAKAAHTLHTMPRVLMALAIFVAGLLMGSVGTLAVTTALFHPLAQAIQEGVAVGQAQHSLESGKP